MVFDLYNVLLGSLFFCDNNAVIFIILSKKCRENRELKECYNIVVTKTEH